jgi:hypothetical protein
MLRLLKWLALVLTAAGFVISAPAINRVLTMRERTRS